MIALFTTHFPDWLMVMCLVALAAWLLFKLALFVVAYIGILCIMIKFAVTGRWKEYMDRCKNDPDFLTFDKETGKFNW